MDNRGEYNTWTSPLDKVAKICKINILSGGFSRFSQVFPIVVSFGLERGGERREEGGWKCKLTWLIRECQRTLTTVPSPIGIRLCSLKVSASSMTIAPLPPFSTGGIPVNMLLPSGLKMMFVSGYRFSNPSIVTKGRLIDLTSHTAISGARLSPTFYSPVSAPCDYSLTITGECKTRRLCFFLMCVLTRISRSGEVRIDFPNVQSSVQTCFYQHKGYKRI